MINWKSILSSFNDKPTLLEWLKLVEKALKESVLTNVLTDTKDGKTAFTFKFEDGTEIKTDYIQTQGDTGPAGPQGPAGPKGDKGDKGEAGGKVYLHKLSVVIPEGAQAQLKFLSPDSSKITTITNELLAKMISGLASNSFPPVYYNVYEAGVENGSMLSLSVYNAYPFNVTQTSNYQINMTHANILDTVIEL